MGEMGQHAVYIAGSALPQGLYLGRNSRVVARELTVGSEAFIGDDVSLVGDRIVLGEGARVASGCDIRAAEVEIGARSEIGTRCSVLAAERFQVGRASRISADCRILCRSFVAGEFLYLAEHCSVGWGGTKESTAMVTLGQRVALGPHNILNANCEIELEDQVGSGSFVTFWTHGYHFGHSILDGFMPAFQKIVVRRNVWLGYHVTVLPGVEIGQNTIVAACSVVAKTMPADKLVGGVPAKVLREVSSQPLQADAAAALVRALLAQWRDSLAWKGAQVPRVFADGFSVQLTDDQGLEYYVFLPHGAVATAEDQERTVWITVDDRADLRCSLAAQETLFECRSGQLTGKPTALSEDLRDFLRRHTLPCGTDNVFSSIEPPSFARLRSL